MDIVIFIRNGAGVIMISRDNNYDDRFHCVIFRVISVIGWPRMAEKQLFLWRLYGIIGVFAC